MNGREEMLMRIRKALGGERSASTLAVGAGPRPRLEGIMPTIAPEDRLTRFEAELGKVAGLSYRASTELELERILRTIIDSSQSAEVVLTRNPLLGQIGLPEKLHAWGKSGTHWTVGLAGKPEATSAEEFRARCFSAGVGISGVDYVLAETGSLVLTSQTEGCQLASLAPPIHVALYCRSQILSSLDDILERLPVGGTHSGTALGRSAVFITGPSRTADIEQILIRGVHGPREVHAILVEESCLGKMRTLQE